MMKQQETKPVAMITGASRGIGAAVAEGLAQDGYRVLLFARSEQGLKQVQARIVASGGECGIFPVDIANDTALDHALAQALETWGRVDVVLNNAGVNVRGTLEPPAEEYRAMLNVNVVGAHAVLRAVVPMMKRQGSGFIFNISSVSGKTGFAGSGAYCSTKFALCGLSEALFSELTPLGIRVTAICPSWTNTEMADYAPIPGEKMLQPADILHAIRFLLTLGPNAVVKELTINCASDVE